MDILVGAKVHLVPPLPYEKGLKPNMEQLRDKLAEAGSKAYLIPVGGSNTVGLWGYLMGFAELMEQDPHISDVVMSCGSGGTACGLALANFLLGSKVKIHAISVCDDEVCRRVSRCVDSEAAVQLVSRFFIFISLFFFPPQHYFHGHVDATLAELGLDAKIKSRDILNVVDGFKGRGYGLSTGENWDLDRRCSIMAQTPCFH